MVFCNIIDDSPKIAIFPPNLTLRRKIADQFPIGSKYPDDTILGGGPEPLLAVFEQGADTLFVFWNIPKITTVLLLKNHPYERLITGYPHVVLKIVQKSSTRNGQNRRRILFFQIIGFQLKTVSVKIADAGMKKYRPDITLGIFKDVCLIDSVETFDFGIAGFLKVVETTIPVIKDAFPEIAEHPQASLMVLIDRYDGCASANSLTIGFEAVYDDKSVIGT